MILSRIKFFAIACALLLPFAGTAIALPVEGIIIEDFTEVTKTYRTGIVTQCRIREGTKVQIRERARNNSNRVYIRVLDGPRRNCYGWIHGHQVKEASEYNHEVTSAGQWGSTVPVFKDRGSFFKGRDKGIINDRTINCHLRPGAKIDFEPFRDWGVGQVKKAEGQGNCRGWFDRRIVRQIN